MDSKYLDTWEKMLEEKAIITENALIIPMTIREIRSYFKTYSGTAPSTSHILRMLRRYMFHHQSMWSKKI